MLTVDQAIAILDATAVTPGVERRPLAEAIGRRLAEDLFTNRDDPPFDKSMMDGYAVRAADVSAVGVTLRVVGDIPAGTMPQRTVEPGEAMSIMTGAPLPAGADAVVPVELTTREGDQVRILPI